MTLAAVLLLAAILAVQGVRLGLDVLDRKKPAIDRHVGDTVVLVLAGTGGSVRGVLAAVAPDALELRKADHLGDQGVVTPLDGKTVVPRGRLDFFQVLASPGDA